MQEPSDTQNTEDPQNPEEPQEPEEPPAPEIKPAIDSFELKEAGLGAMNVTWKSVDAEKVKLEWSLKEDFSDAKTQTVAAADGQFSITSLEKFKVYFLKITPVNGDIEGESKTAKADLWSGYIPSKLEIVNNKVTIGNNKVKLSVRVKSRNGKEVPSKYFVTEQPAKKTTGVFTGYVTFINEYKIFPKMSFTYTVNPPKPSFLWTYDANKTSMRFYIDLSGVKKTYDYCEVECANNASFKNSKKLNTTGTNSIKTPFNNLKPNTKYWIRARYVKKAGGKVLTSEYIVSTFVTAGNAPRRGDATSNSILASMKKNKSFVVNLPRRMIGTEIASFMNALRDDYPQYDKYNIAYIYDGDKVVKIKMAYNSAKAKRAKKMEQKINSIVKYAKRRKGTRAKVSYVNYRLCKMCSYHWTAYRHHSRGNSIAKYADAYEAYGCLVNGKAVCSGYSKAFNAVMVQLGIPTTRVVTRDHAWNKVKIGNQTAENIY